MIHLKFFRWNLDSVLRLVSDAMMIAISFVVAVFAWSSWSAYTGTGEGSFLALVNTQLGAFSLDLVALVTVGLLIFVGTGFYTRGRAYRGRYKALIIFQAVALTYLIFALLLFLFPAQMQLPKAVFFLGWGITLATILCSRLLTAVLKWVVNADEPKPTVVTSLIGNPQQVALIGGAGYVGSPLLPRLLDDGYRVCLLDLMLFGEKPIADVINHPNLRIMRADYRQIDKLVEVMRGSDAVIHLGGIVGDPACSLDEELTIDVNITSTRVLGEVARGNGVRRLIFASSCSVYGASDDVLDEYSKLNPVSLYAKSKIASERVLSGLANEDFSPVFLRFGTIYGLSGRTRFDLVVNLLTAKAIVDGEITVFGPDQWRPFVHVDDVAEAVMLALKAPRSAVANEAFSIGSNEQNYTIGQIGEMIHKKIPSARLIVTEMDDDKRNYRVNFDKARRILGFNPAWTLDQGIDQVAEAVRSGHINYRDPQYSNVKHLMASQGNSQLVKSFYNNGWEAKLLEEAV